MAGFLRARFLEPVKDFYRRKFIYPLLIKKGWRPARFMSMEKYFLNGHYGYDEEPEIFEAIARVSTHTMVSVERLATLWQQVRYLDRCGIGGSFIECGVWRGGVVGMMALAHQRSEPKASRHLHLFDSFEGLPEPKRDIDGDEAAAYSHGKATGAMKSVDECVGSLEDNKALLERQIQYPANLIHYHKGWFDQIIPGDAGKIGPIALLRLDGDWYESTMICLRNLYPHVVKGGVIVIDDYARWQGCRKAVDEFISSLKEPVLLNHVDGVCRFWMRIP